MSLSLQELLMKGLDFTICMIRISLSGVRIRHSFATYPQCLYLNVLKKRNIIIMKTKGVRGRIAKEIKTL